MGIGEKALAAIVDPFHRAPHPARGPQHQSVLGIERILRPEAAAHIVGQRAKLVRRYVQDLLGQLIAVGVHVLTGECQHQAIAGIVIVTDSAAGLDGCRRHPLIVEKHGHHVGCIGNSRVHGAGVAGLETHAQVAGYVIPHQGRVGRQRLVGSHDSRQRPVRDLDQLRRVAGRLGGLGNHRRHRIADEARPRRDESLALGRRNGRIVTVLRRGARGDAAQTVGDPVGAGEHRQHARGRRRGSGFDGFDERVGVDRAQDEEVCHMGHGHVIDVSARSRQKSLVFPASNRLTDAVAFHGGRVDRCGIHTCNRCS